ncbi:MAG: cell surface protein SprA [Deferribacteres bacterium]|nr:cell surface protein SprA [candidate division KSB1 bacterium]MCB9511860.1 cell surface protein SprA [Deferribacteres bacterium]
MSRKFPVIFSSFFCSLLFSGQQIFAQEPALGVQEGPGLRIQLGIDRRAELFPEDRWQGMSLSGFSGTLLSRPSGWMRKVALDSTSTYVIANESVNGSLVRQSRTIPLSEYMALSVEHNRHKMWREATLQSLFAAKTRRSGSGGLNIEIPVEIKSRAFQKIFGGDRVGLNVQGEIRIDGGFRNENRSEVKTSIAQGSNTNFKMNQTQRFTVTGKIGEKVTVNVDQDSERTLDFENNIKLNYKGFEDEVIQSIEAGNISLSLPATRFVTFSGKSTGLFGVKMDMQLGDLHLTTIASQEKGESQKLTAGGGATGNQRQIRDYEFRRYTYFFLSDEHRDQYRQYAFKWQHIYNPAIAIRRIEIYKSLPGYQEKPEAIQGFALPNPANQADTSRTEKEYYRGHFIRLEPDRDYFIENNLGYIVMNQPLNEDEVLAVAYEDSSLRKVGDIDYDFTSNLPIFLKIIKAQSPQPSYKNTWNLEWKNVYYLGSRNIDKEGFEIKIFKKAQGAGTDDESQGADSFLKIFGLDTRDVSGNLQPDGKLDDDPNVINWARGELILPYLRPFDPREDVIIGGTAEPSLLDQDDFEPAIYDTTSQRWITQNSNFYFEFTSTSASTNYNLGFNVIEDSEEVILNGEPLVRGQGYTIDYWSGTLNVLDSRASLPNAQVDITYERNQLFQLQKKTILGTRAEYRFGRDSFLGGTLLYLNERTLDQKVRVGSGPMRNLVWDLNTSLKFEPNFLTTALDALPIIDATQPSRLNFEGEIAQVLPNPNTLNSQDTNDNNGVAYIDDFEGAKRTTPLGVHRRAYTLASAPVEYIPGNIDAEYQRSVEKMGSLVWFNPFSGVDKRDIYPNQEVNSQTGFTQDVLTMQFTPKSDGAFAPQESWAGVMRALSPGFFDQTESKFLEIMVRGDVGVLHINLGQISEDVIPNKKFDTEDKLRGGIREGRLDDDEDVGLDGMGDGDPRATAANGDFWDINNNGTKESFEPFSNDNWFYQTQSNDYDHINGTEANANDGTREPDTEDLNGNGTTDLANNYFEYSFDLNKFSPDTTLIAGGQGNPAGWRLYRIPLNEPRKVVGSPDLGLTEYIRLWVNGADAETQISIAEINLVGNEWRELNREDEQLAVAVINTHENPEYIQPPGVQGVRDRITQVQAREQSLVLKVNNLVPDTLVMAQKSFFEAQNYIHYARMRMFVYANDFTGQHMLPTVGSEPVEADTMNSDIVFFIRFGTNEQNYYEFRELVFSGDGTTTGAWNPRNEMDIPLSELTNLKFSEAYLNYLTRLDSLQYFEQQIGPTKWYRIKGEPSLTNVRVLYAGVENLGKLSSIPFTGEVWLNELRLSDVEKEKGIAMRARMDLGLSDFISVNAEVNRQDADFHNVGTRFGTGDNRTATSLNGNVKLDKLLPKSWGISLPLTLNYSESQSTPKYAPGKDILITDNTPQDEVDASRSTNVQKGFGLSFNKTTRSKNFFVKHTLDNVRASVSQTVAEQTSPTVESSARSAWAGNFDYSLQFGQKTFVQPFKFLSGLPLLKSVGETKLYYLPRNFNGKVAGNLSKTNSLTRLGAATNVYTYDLTRSYSTNVKIFENLSGSFARNWRGDARESGWMGLFNGDIVDLSKGQNLNADYSPQFFNWLNNKVSYSSNYRYTNNITNQRTGRSAGTSTNLSANMTLKFSQLFKSTPSQGATTRRRTPPGRRRTPPGQRQGEEQNKDDAEKDKAEEDTEASEEKPKGRSINPLDAIKFIGKALSNFRDISLTASRRKNISNIGLEEGDPTFEYMLGFTSDPGLGTVADVATNTFTENITESFGASTGLQLSRNFDLTLRFTHDEQRNATTQVTGNYSDSWLKLGDFNLPFPEWTLSISGLEKLKLFSVFAKSITASHNFTGKRSIVWKSDRDQTTKEDFSISFRPLLKVSISWHNGMQTNFQIDRTRGFNNTFNPIFIDDFLELRQVGGQRSTQQNISFSTNYSKRGGLKIPFFKNPLNNTIDFSVTFNMNSTINESIRGESNEYVVSSERSSWTFEPRVTYSFSNRVRGGTHFQIGKTKSTLAGDVSIKEFGIDVNISIRGQ